MKSKTDLQNLFDKYGVSFDSRIIFSCGSGVTACVIFLALYELGHKKISVFDGLWSSAAAKI